MATDMDLQAAVDQRLNMSLDDLIRRQRKDKTTSAAATAAVPKPKGGRARGRGGRTKATSAPGSAARGEGGGAVLRNFDEARSVWLGIMGVSCRRPKRPNPARQCGGKGLDSWSPIVSSLNLMHVPYLTIAICQTVPVRRSHAAPDRHACSR